MLAYIRWYRETWLRLKYEPNWERFIVIFQRGCSFWLFLEHRSVNPQYAVPYIHWNRHPLPTCTESQNPLETLPLTIFNFNYIYYFLLIKQQEDNYAPINDLIHHQYISEYEWLIFMIDWNHQYIWTKIFENLNLI
jgi:hypothetical protein